MTATMNDEHVGVEDPPSSVGRCAELAAVTAGCEGTQAGSIHRLMLEQIAHLVPANEWRNMMAWAKVYVDLWGDLPDRDSGNPQPAT